MSKYDAVHAKLEAEGRFDEYTTPIHYETMKKVGDDFVYLPKNIFFRLWVALLTVIVYLLGPIVNFFAYGVRVRGRKNLKGVKAAVTVSNHVLYLDYLVLRQAFRHHKFYVTAAEHNNKKGFPGMILRGGRMLPLGGTLTAQKNFFKAVKTCLAGRCYVHFYAEQALWYRYEKPRPLKRGAFDFAARSDVPVVPALLCFKEPKGLTRLLRGGKKTVVVQICPPIYPQSRLSAKENAEYLWRACENAMDAAYLDFYGIPNDIRAKESEAAR